MRKNKNKLNATELAISASHQAFVKKHMKKMRIIRIYQILIITCFITLWELATRVKILNSFIFSSPSRVVRTFLDMASDGSIFYHMGITLMETFISFALVIIIGFLVATLLWWNDSVAKVLEP